MPAMEARVFVQVPWQALTELIQAYARFVPASLPQNRKKD